MKLAFSNIAWTPAVDDAVIDILKENKFDGIEIAPTKIWSDPSSVSEMDAKKIKDLWAHRGLPILAMQSLLFGHPELILFGDSAACDNLMSYLKKIILLASHLGVGPMVFGSPKNRLRGSRPISEVMPVALEFFKKLGDFASQHRTQIVIEANAEAYGCDFLNTSEQSSQFVRDVKSAGIALHLDLGNMVYQGEDYIQQITKLIPVAAHFHLSRPQMKPLDSEWLTSAISADVFRNYPHTLSVEMLCPEDKIIESIKMTAEAVQRKFATL